jgi:hypothetical protein
MVARAMRAIVGERDGGNLGLLRCNRLASHAVLLRGAANTGSRPRFRH